MTDIKDIIQHLRNKRLEHQIEIDMIDKCINALRSAQDLEKGKETND